MTHKCECPSFGISAAEGGAPDEFYHPFLELPFRVHAPNECKCTNELKLYKHSSRHNERRWLCSCCWTDNWTEVPQ